MSRALWRVALSVSIVAACTSTPPTPTVVSTAAPSASARATPAPSALTSPPSPTTAEPNGAFPTTVLGLTVHSVSEEKALATSGQLDGRFIAVAGYWSQLMPSCPYLPHQSVMTGFCTGIRFDDVSSTPQQSIGDPNVIVAPETVNGTDLWSSQTPSEPAAVVVVGHAGDSRSWQCKPDDRAACQQKFVLDRVVWINGQDVPPGSPNSQLTLSQVQMTPEQAAAAAVKPDEKLLVAYPVQARSVNDVDPRFLGIGATPAYVGGLSPVVWYVRVLSGTPDPDGIADGAARLVDDATGNVLAEMQMPVAADYQPARVQLDLAPGSSTNWAGSDLNPRGEVRSAGDAIFADYAGLSSTPAALAAGQYDLHGFMGNQYGGGENPEYDCDLTVTVDAGSNVAYAGKFTKSGCNWAPSTSEF